jgi:acetyl esterase/lipase
MVAAHPLARLGGGVRDSHDILSDPPPSPARARLAYGSEPLQFGDLRAPPAGGAHPLAIVVHGGFWKANFNLIHTGHLCNALCERGFVTWNVEYRRVGDPGGGWPGSFEDVLAAVRFARRLANADSGRIVLVGHSAGGHLALLVAARERLPVVAVAAVSDLVGWQTESSEAFLGEAERAEASYSPLQALPIGVRQVLVHGTNDDVVPYRLSERYVAQARATGDDATLVRLDDTGHFEPIDPLAPQCRQVLEAVADVVP